MSRGFSEGTGHEIKNWSSNMKKKSPRLTLVALSLIVPIAGADIQDSDFRFHDEGQAIFINGKKGAPLHIDYIGPTLTKPLKVRITPTNPALKVNPSMCTFSRKDDDCRLTVYLAKNTENVYGIQDFDVSELRGQALNIDGQVGSTGAESVSFGVGVQVKDMPAPVFWNTQAPVDGRNGRVIIVNATSMSRTYKGYFSIGSSYNYKTESYGIRLPSDGICYLDNDAMQADDLPSDYKPVYMYYLASNWLGGYDNSRGVRDITNTNDPIFNGAYRTGNNNISTCSANDARNCASNKWESWSVGLANTGATNLKDGLNAGQVVALRDNSWDSGDTIYYKGEWARYGLELLLIQGSIDGKGFDANAKLPSALSIKSAPPCSEYIQ
jgi:hypothetical protein